MRLQFDTRDDICILSLKGPFTTGSDLEYRQAKEQIQKGGVANIIANCTELPYIDSTGLSFLVGLYTTLRAWGGRFVVASANSRVRGLLELTRLISVIPVFDDVDSAVVAIRHDKDRVV